MISALQGKIVGQDERAIMLEVHGVTFRIFVVPRPTPVFSVGQECKVMTFLYVRDDALDLYGFATVAEMKLFERLLSVSGVGPRLALGVLSAGEVADLEEAIERGDASLLTKVSGVGTKTAQRIVIDLRGKLAELGENTDSALSSIIDALVSLGYSAREAREAAAATTAGESIENRVRAALRRMGRKP